MANILAGLPAETDPRLLVGASTADDAGVFKLTDEIALIQTVDFFTPIVNEPYLFGQIAACNALSDVYAMGGRPLTAMNVCCFPVKSLAPEIFREILRGGLDKVHEAGAVLAGGHSVEDSELKYGLAVTGVVHPDRIVANAGLKPGQILVLTKPLGTGVVATALKAGLAGADTVAQAVGVMNQLNAGGAEVMQLCGVTGATDITGFGLLGHALELAKASNLGLEIVASQVPILPDARQLLGMGLFPGGSHANRAFCQKHVSVQGTPDSLLLDLMVDAQTSGGLLMGLDLACLDRALDLLVQRGYQAAVIGSTTPDHPGLIEVRF